MNAQTHAPFHCLVWIDHNQARLYAVSKHDLAELALIHAPDNGRGHIHHYAGAVGPGHEAPHPEFLKAVVTALGEPEEILITGPADAKHALKHYIAEKHPGLDRRILGIETLARSHAQDLQAFAYRYFHAADRMRAAP